MPYIITTRTFDHEHTFGSVPFINPPTRTAVATLDEARDYTFNARVNDDGQIEPLPAEGGTVGPLPDGTVIEVRPISFGALASRAGFAQFSDERPHAEIIAAFNGAQS